MAIFEAIKLTWKGVDYEIPPDQVMRGIARIEDVFTLGELSRHMARGTLPLAKIAQAYGVALRHAGAAVSDEDVYAGMFSGDAAELQKRGLAAVNTLLVMMMPPEHLRAKEPEKKAEAGAAPTPTAH
jgi:hypothetical protein